MGQTKTIGGDRLGSGKKMKVDLKGYERSTHNLGYLWQSTMAAGTLVPFMKELVLPGDTYDIHLETDLNTHPTIGPLFGSYKVQLDVFQCPVRLYQGQLHNNKMKIGLNMSAIKLPQMGLFIDADTSIPNETPDNAQINSSCILSYLDIRGIGSRDPADTGQIERHFNAIPYLAYWDIVKNYYANKQEEIGFVIHTAIEAIVDSVDTINIGSTIVQEAPLSEPIFIEISATVTIHYITDVPNLEQIQFETSQGLLLATNVIDSPVIDSGSSMITGVIYGDITIYNWSYINPDNMPIMPPTPVEFPLSALDDMREFLLTNTTDTTPVVINDFNAPPYSLLLNWMTVTGGNFSPYTQTQEGLALKTYQSDLFNNWISTDWIEGPGGISEITAVSTVGDLFTIDTLNLSKKVYDMLNRIAISDGTYYSWMETVYDHQIFARTETPMYHGGLIRELAFQQIVSNSESPTGGQNGERQPLGTLAGKGTLTQKRKGGNIIIKVDEPSYIIGIISLTPRITYSQGNKWDTTLQTMDDFHKPQLDEIGFQDLIQEQMAYWTTKHNNATGEWEQKAAGKQPAWINYMTNVNQARGNFANEQEMFMTLNRRYEKNADNIQDLTTYIDPSKFNFIFADTAVDAQNFWVQIAVDITARRKMSAKIMPNL